jgi:peptidyl-prolyl isomerase E (cyclophilin E)
MADFTTRVEVSGKGSNPKTALYVGGLDESVTAATLRAAFLPFGDLKDVSVPLDNATGKHRGFGFVQFEAAEDAADAVDNMHGAELYGRALKVNYAQPAKAGKGGAAQAVWAQADEWYENQERENELDRLEEEERKAAERAALAAQQPGTLAAGGAEGDPS